MSVKKDVVFREPEALAIDDVGCFVGGSTTKFGMLRDSLTKIDCSTRSQDAFRTLQHDTTITTQRHPHIYMTALSTRVHWCHINSTCAKQQRVRSIRPCFGPGDAKPETLVKPS